MRTFWKSDFEWSVEDQPFEKWISRKELKMMAIFACLWMAVRILDGIWILNHSTSECVWFSNPHWVEIYKLEVFSLRIVGLRSNTKWSNLGMSLDKMAAKKSSYQNFLDQNDWFFEWGSVLKYSGDLKSGCWMVQKRLGCKWSGFPIESAIPKHNHLKYRPMAAIWSKTIWNLDKNVWILNDLVFKCLGL